MNTTYDKIEQAREKLVDLGSIDHQLNRRWARHFAECGANAIARLMKEGIMVPGMGDVLNHCIRTMRDDDDVNVRSLLAAWHRNRGAILKAIANQ